MKLFTTELKQMVYNIITCNECREMDFERFDQAVEEIYKFNLEYIKKHHHNYFEHLRLSISIALKCSAEILFKTRGHPESVIFKEFFCYFARKRKISAIKIIKYVGYKNTFSVFYAEKQCIKHIDCEVEYQEKFEEIKKIFRSF